MKFKRCLFFSFQFVENQSLSFYTFEGAGGQLQFFLFKMIVISVSLRGLLSVWKLGQRKKKQKMVEKNTFEFRYNKGDGTTKVV